MPWFKVDDTFAMHEKVMSAGNAAIGLWTRCGAWSMQQLTDGFVPDHVLRVLGTPKERRTLVEVSLWEEVEGGVRFLNWDERQPTKAQVETARQAAAERQRHARERAKSRRDSQRDSQASNGVSHGPPDPTRPDPTPKSTSGGDGKPSTPAEDSTAQTLVGEWIDRCAVRPPGRVIGQTSKEIKTMLAEGVAPERIRDGMLEWQRKGLHASTLPSVVHEVSNRTAPMQIRRLPDARDIEQPPDGLSPAEYDEWLREQRAKRASR